jgi:hypothetical protein
MHRIEVNVQTGETTQIPLTPEEIAAFEAAAIEASRITRDMVNAERDRRINEGFPFALKTIQFDPSSQSNILGAVQMAVLATLAGGGQAGDYLWHDGDTPFQWITADNSTLTLDAPGVIALGQSGAAFKSLMIFKARALKDMTPIPAGYADNSYWS